MVLGTVPSANEVGKHSGLETAWARVQVLCPAAAFTYLNFGAFNYALSSLSDGTFASNVCVFEFSFQGTEQTVSLLSYLLPVPSPGIAF